MLGNFNEHLKRWSTLYPNAIASKFTAPPSYRFLTDTCNAPGTMPTITSQTCMRCIAFTIFAVLHNFPSTTDGRPLPDGDECPASADCRQEVDLTLIVDESSAAGKLALSGVAKELMSKLDGRKQEGNWYNYGLLSYNAVPSAWIRLNNELSNKELLERADVAAAQPHTNTVKEGNAAGGGDVIAALAAYRNNLLMRDRDRTRNSTC